MRRLSIVFAVAVFGIAAPPPARGADAFADPLCPRAVPKVVAFNDAAPSNDMTKIGAAARDAAEAYRACASEAQATLNLAIEPTVNYDKTRAAQFLVVAGRAAAARGDDKAAVAALRDAKLLATDVAEWQPQSLAYHMSSGRAGNSSQRNTDRNGSRYKSAADDIVAAANEALAKLDASPALSAPPLPKA